MNNKLLIIILIIIIVIIIIYNNKYIFIQQNDMFGNIKYYDPQAVIANDGKMNFDFLNDPQYTNKILNEYYLNDDMKLNGVKLNYHPQQSR